MYEAHENSLITLVSKFLTKIEKFDEKCTLIWADLPAGLALFVDSDVILEWNEWKMQKLYASIFIAKTFLSCEGFFVIASSAEKMPIIVPTVMQETNLKMVHTMLLATASQNRKPNFDEDVFTVIITFFAFSDRTRVLNKIFTLDIVAMGSLGYRSNTIIELPRGALYTFTNNDGNPLRGASERHTNFYKFLISMCTPEEEVVIDCFAGEGNMACVCEEMD
ncbi:hypothetical protein L7F22_069428 [Adiantum nelumboides]|nr:hypothetical protein [Adiantum nelumboides]